MNKHHLSFLAATLLLTTVSCDFLKKGNPAVGFDVIETEVEVRDSTVYGVCGRATSMNSLQLITDRGDTLFLSIANASEAGNVFGGIKPGEHMAVLMSADSTEAVHVVNTTALLGDWVMEDPIDGSSEVGISIKDGGKAESINHTTIQYESWRLINGELELVNTRDDGVDMEETLRYKIVSVGPDSLVIEELGNPSADTRADIYRYSRQKPKEEFKSNIVIEESKFEDFLY